MRLAIVLLTLSLLAQNRGLDTDVTEPAHARQLLQAKGDGVQIYSCKSQGLAFEWVFKAPEAKLMTGDGRQPIGTHGAGPTWTASDGSSIKGKILQQRVSPDPLSIPWLLLGATPAAGPGVFSHVVFVRRSDTRGGIAPADGCDAAHLGSELRVPYSATYTFYATE